MKGLPPATQVMRWRLQPPEKKPEGHTYNVERGILRSVDPRQLRGRTVERQAGDSCEPPSYLPEEKLFPLTNL